MLAKGLVLLGSKDPEMLLVENFHISIYLRAARRLPSSDREWCFNRKQQSGADSAKAVTGFWLKFNRIGLKIGRVKVQMCFWNLFIKTSHFVMNITGLGWGWAWQPAIILWDLSQNSLIERCHSSANHRRELIDGEDWTPGITLAGMTHRWQQPHSSQPEHIAWHLLLEILCCEEVTVFILGLGRANGVYSP